MKRNLIITTRTHGIKLQFVMVCLVGLTFISFQSSLCAEDPVVTIVKVSGNRVTSKQFILDEMEIAPGSRLTEDMIERDELWLQSTGLFNRVDIRAATTSGRAVVHVIVYEPFYFYLLPGVNYQPARPEQTLVKVKTLHKNLLGYGQQLWVGGQMGYNRGYFISYKDPWFSLPNNFSLSSKFAFDDQEISGLDDKKYRLENTLIRFELRHRFNRHSWMGYEAAWERRMSSWDLYTYSNGDEDQTLTLKVKYHINRRDYRYYPSRGYYVMAVVEGSQLTNSFHQYLIERLEIRNYKRFGGLILALRLWGESSQSSLPYYRRSSLTTEVMRGDHDFGGGGWMSVAGSVEIRFNLLEKDYYNLDFIPWLGKYLRQLPFSTEGVCFYDRGHTKFNREGDVTRKYLISWGTGVQIQVPFVQTFHVLTGWTPEDELSSPELLIKTGVTF